LVLSFEEIRKLLPQSYPFLFVDRVLELEPGKRILCLKNVSGGEPYFQGHFPNFAIMPGALILEGLAQSAILLFQKSGDIEEKEDTVFVVAGVKARLVRPVLPGDTLLYEITVEKAISTGAIVNVIARVGDEVAVKGSLTFGMTETGKLQKQGE